MHLADIYEYIIGIFLYNDMDASIPNTFHFVSD